MKHFILFITSILAILSQTTIAQTTHQWTLGADIGWNTEYEQNNQKLYDYHGREQESTALMQQMGMTAIRIRVWVDPVGAGKGKWCALDDVLEKCRRAKALGMDIMIDFHYSDWWADPAKQNIPKSWEGHSYKKMLNDLSDHTRHVLSTLKAEGITPRWVQVGNEISNGFLWSVEMDPVTGWEKKDADGNTIMTRHMAHLPEDAKQFAGFFKAGYDAVKEVCPEAQVIVHFDNGFDNDLYTRNLDILRSNGAKWDIIGMSLYPYWSIEAGKEPTAQKTIIDCIRNINRIYRDYATPSMIVETGYEVNEQNPWIMSLGRQQLSDLIYRCKNETDGHCLGVFYWEPECRPQQYKLGAFSSDGHPTEIMRAMTTAAILDGHQADYDRPIVKIETSKGDIIIELYNETPIHRDNFLRLVNDGALDGMLFHRVIRDFMIQTGDPKSKNAPQTSLDNPAPQLGDDDVPTASGENSLPAEIRYPQLFHKRGALASARESDDVNPDRRSSSSQFYIVWGHSPATSGRRPYVPRLGYYDYEKDAPYSQSSKYSSYMPSPAGTPWLDGGYTVFGEVLQGFDIIDQIQQSPTDKYDRPLTDISIKSVKFPEVKSPMRKM